MLCCLDSIVLLRVKRVALTHVNRAMVWDGRPYCIPSLFVIWQANFGSEIVVFIKGQVLGREYEGEEQQSAPPSNAPTHKVLPGVPL